MSAAGAAAVLAAGEIELLGRMPWSSNGTFLVSCTADGESLAAVYKPERGERPLWDFPTGIWRREVAAYEVSELLGWGLVPETVARAGGPLGAGSLQRLVDADVEIHAFTLLDAASHDDELRRVAAFDVLINNADRKAGHCVVEPSGRLWAIDHGLCFHVAPKLRTVLWDFAGEPLPDDVRRDLAGFGRRERELAVLEDLLDADEVEALRRRAAGLARRGRFPKPDPTRHNAPWPLV